MLSEEKMAVVKQRLEKLTRSKIRNKKIKSITVNPAHHSLPPMTITVGEKCKNLEPDSPAEEVLAIFEASAFLVCTENRGIDKGLPYFFVRADVRKVEEF
jgi:hypothetical protein